MAAPIKAKPITESRGAFAPPILHIFPLQKIAKMELIELGEKSSLLKDFIAEVRDEKIQGDRMRFRRNLERIGQVFAYELSKVLPYEEKAIQTTLGEKKTRVLQEQPVIATILRAGLPFHEGMLNFFDKADNAFISAYRMPEKSEKGFKIAVEYMASPSLEGRTLIICDPMLASGNSMEVVYKALKEKGKPKEIHIVSIIGSDVGINKVDRFLPRDATLWIGEVDHELTANAYIVPGLGDAGDLSFGKKGAE